MPTFFLRAVFGKRVRQLLETYEDVAGFYSPDMCYQDARKYILLSRSAEALTPPPVYPFSMKSAALSNLWIGACTKTTKRFLASASILVTRKIGQ